MEGFLLRTRMSLFVAAACLPVVLLGGAIPLAQSASATQPAAVQHSTGPIKSVPVEPSAQTSSAPYVAIVSLTCATTQYDPPYGILTVGWYNAPPGDNTPYLTVLPGVTPPGGEEQLFTAVPGRVFTVYVPVNVGTTYTVSVYWPQAPQQEWNLPPQTPVLCGGPPPPKCNNGPADANSIAGIAPAYNGLGGPTVGYWKVSPSGGVSSFGKAVFHGSMGGCALNQPITNMVSTPDGGGYWLVANDGGTFAFGDAKFYGSTGAAHLNEPVVSLAPTPDNKGYWLVASDGGIFAFGDAHFHGSTGSTHLNDPVVGMASTPDGKGYWLVASDGGLFAFGDAKFYGSMGGKPLNRPIIGMVPSPDGKGYYLVASDGGVFAFGDAHFSGSAGGTHLNTPVVGFAVNTNGGYWLVTQGSDVTNTPSQTLAFGGAPSYG